GATSATYHVVSADVGASLDAVVTATNQAGSASATSAQTAVVTAAPPVNTALPGITGTAHETSTLTAGNGTWTGTAPITFTYEWPRCDTAGNTCAAIPSATAATSVVASADVGSTIRVAVTATNAAGSVTAVSAATATVTPVNTPPPPDQPPVTAGLQL